MFVCVLVFNMFRVWKEITLCILDRAATSGFTEGSKKGCTFAYSQHHYADSRNEDLEFGVGCFQSGKGKDVLDKAIVSLIREHTLRLFQVGSRRGVNLNLP